MKYYLDSILYLFLPSLAYCRAMLRFMRLHCKISCMPQGPCSLIKLKAIFYSEGIFSEVPRIVFLTQLESLTLRTQSLSDALGFYEIVGHHGSASALPYSDYTN
jgi:hypothetical protein